MPTVGAVLRYSTTGGPQASAVLSYSVENGDEAVLTYSVDGGATEAIYGSPDFVLVGFEVEVDGELVDVLSLTCGQNLRRAIQTWSLSRVLPGDGSWTWDNPLLTFAPSIGLREVNIFGVYQTPAGLYRFPRIEGGLAHDEQISIEVTDKGPRYVQALSGTCGAGRLDGLLVTLDLPRGHGQTAARVAETLLRQVGATGFALDPDGPMYSLYQPRDTPAIPEASDLMERLGRALYRDASGIWRNPRIGIRGSAPLEFALTLADLQDLSIKIKGDVPTSATLTADIQVTREAEDACGRETVPPVIVDAEVEFAPRVAGYIIDGTGSPDATGLAAGVARLRLQRRTTATLETQCGITRTEGTRVDEYRWRETPRRRWTGSAYVNLPGVYLAMDADAGGTGSEPAYLGAYEEWTAPSAESTTIHYYDYPGWAGPQGLGEPWHDHFGAATATRYKTGTISREWGWGFRRSALKSRIDPTDPWDTVDPITNARLRGGGDAVQTSGPTEYFGPEAYGLQRMVVATITGSGGKLDRMVEYVYTWHHRPGTEFLYAGEASGSMDAVEVWGLVEVKETLYLEQGPRTLKVQTVTNVITGEIGRQRVPDREGRPALERLPNEAVDLSLYGTPEEAEAARQARPGEVRRAKVALAVPVAESYHRPRHDKSKVDGVEADEELTRMATDILIRGMSIEVSGKLKSPNFQLRPGIWGTLAVPPFAADPLECQLDGVSESCAGYNEVREQQVTLSIYPRLAST